MGSVTIKFCCGCGERSEALTLYTQQTDFEGRSTDFYNSENKLELCDPCLSVAKSDFQARRKFTCPALPANQLLLFKEGS